MARDRRIILVGSIFLLLGAFLPWETGYYSLRSWFERMPYLVMFSGFLGFVHLVISLVWQGKTGKRYSLPSAILSFIPVAMSIFFCLSSCVIVAALGGDFASAIRGMGLGVYLTFIGGMMVIMGAVAITPEKRSNQEE